MPVDHAVVVVGIGHAIVVTGAVIQHADAIVTGDGGLNAVSSDQDQVAFQVGQGHGSAVDIHDVLGVAGRIGNDVVIGDVADLAVLHHAVVGAQSLVAVVAAVLHGHVVHVLHIVVLSRHNQLAVDVNQAFLIAGGNREVAVAVIVHGLVGSGHDDVAVAVLDAVLAVLTEGGVAGRGKVGTVGVLHGALSGKGGIIGGDGAGGAVLNVDAVVDHIVIQVLIAGQVSQLALGHVEDADVLDVVESIAVRIGIVVGGRGCILQGDGDDPVVADLQDVVLEGHNGLAGQVQHAVAVDAGHGQLAGGDVAVLMVQVVVDIAGQQVAVNICQCLTVVAFHTQQVGAGNKTGVGQVGAVQSGSRKSGHCDDHAQQCNGQNANHLLHTMIHLSIINRLSL